MKAMKKSMLVGAGVVTIGLAAVSGAGIASAATGTASTGNGSLADQIATTFHLDKTKVQAVIDDNRQAHHAEMEAKNAAALKQAVSDGKLTQAQADHITSVWNEIKTLRGTTKPEDMSAATRDQIKQKIADLRTWLKDQNIDLRSLGVRGPIGEQGHGHGFGGRHMDSDDAASPSTSSSSSVN